MLYTQQLNNFDATEAARNDEPAAIILYIINSIT